MRKETMPAMSPNFKQIDFNKNTIIHKGLYITTVGNSIEEVSERLLLSNTALWNDVELIYYEIDITKFEYRPLSFDKQLLNDLTVSIRFNDIVSDEELQIKFIKERIKKSKKFTFLIPVESIYQLLKCRRYVIFAEELPESVNHEESLEQVKQIDEIFNFEEKLKLSLERGSFYYFTNHPQTPSNIKSPNLIGFNIDIGSKCSFENIIQSLMKEISDMYLLDRRSTTKIDIEDMTFEILTVKNITTYQLLNIFGIDIDSVGIECINLHDIDIIHIGDSYYVSSISLIKVFIKLIEQIISCITLTSLDKTIIYNIRNVIDTLLII